MATNAQSSRRPNRPQRPPAPELPEMDALDRTHRRMLERLADMAQLLARLEAGDADDDARKLASEICRFFDQEARQHHADEERVVFPELVAIGDSELTQHVLRLQQDHGWLEEDWFQIEPLLQALARGQSSVDLEQLRYMLPVFEALLREHIALEESIVYPAARKRREAAAARRAAAG